MKPSDEKIVREMARAMALANNEDDVDRCIAKGEEWNCECLRGAKAAYRVARERVLDEAAIAGHLATISPMLRGASAAQCADKVEAAILALKDTAP